MKGFYDQFEGELEGHALTADELKNGSRGIGSYFRKLNNGILSNDIRNATVEKCLKMPNTGLPKHLHGLPILLILRNPA